VAVTGRGTAAAVVALLTLALLGPVHATQIDQEASRVGFTLKTRWGKTLVGHFPRHEGVITRMSGGMHQVRLRLSTADVEIEDSTTFTRLTRGDGFFDAARYPWVEFVSDPYPVSLIREGGRLGGVLTIRGVERRETFVVSPPDCDDPGVGCDIVARGTVDRDDYHMGRWGFALSDEVVFSLHMRIAPDDGT